MRVADNDSAYAFEQATQARHYRPSHPDAVPKTQLKDIL